jgi:hypothetical protein
MNTRAIVLLSLMGLLGIVYVWFFLMPRGGELMMAYVHRPPRPPAFNFSRPVIFDEIKITVYEPGPPGAEDEGYDRVIWHLLPHPENKAEREERRNVTYGRGIRGMQAAEGMPRRPEALQPGMTYTFEARTSGGDRIKREFTAR